MESTSRVGCKRVRPVCRDSCYIIASHELFFILGGQRSRFLFKGESKTEYKIQFQKHRSLYFSKLLIPNKPVVNKF